MVNLDFKVYDNMESYKKYNPIVKDDVLKQLVVEDMWIKPPHLHFWFRTNMEKETDIFDPHATYAHIHEGTPLRNDQVQFDDKSLVPILIQKHQLHYDHKKRQIQLKRSLFPWHTPFWIKRNVGYLGTEEPTKTHKILGNVFFNYHSEEISFILNLYSSRKITEDEKLKLHSS